jgi:hypothetical protein
MRAGLADEFAARPAAVAPPGQLASPALALIYNETVGLSAHVQGRTFRASPRYSDGLGYWCRVSAKPALMERDPDLVFVWRVNAGVSTLESWPPFHREAS